LGAERLSCERKESQKNAFTGGRRGLPSGSGSGGTQLTRGALRRIAREPVGLKDKGRESAMAAKEEGADRHNRVRMAATPLMHACARKP